MTNTTTYRDGDNWIIRYDEDGEATVSRQTARYDARVRIPAGTVVTLRPQTIGGADASWDGAYFFSGTTTGTVVGGGYPGELGDTLTVTLRPYGYMVRAEAAPN